MKLTPEIKAAIDQARAGDVKSALAVLLDGENEIDEQVQGFVFMLLQVRSDLKEALLLADRCVEDAASDDAKSLWLLRRGLLHLDRDDKMRAIIDLSQVLRLDCNADHTDQARRAMARTLNPDPFDPVTGERRHRKE